MNPSTLRELTEHFEESAGAVDRSGTGVREGLRHVAERGLIDLGVADGVADRGLLSMVRVIAAIARADMSTAFSLWCHRMVIEYLSAAAPGSFLRESLAPRLRSGEVLGSTALSAASAHAMRGDPLPVSFETYDSGLRLTGAVRWASNLLPPFVAVTAAVAAHEPDRKLIVAVPDDVDGLVPGDYPELLALQATGSASLKLLGARVGPGWIVTDDFDRFLQSVFPTFLLLQCALCMGITGRALDEARRGADRGWGDVVARDVAELDRRAHALSHWVEEVARDGNRAGRPRAEILDLRLSWAHLAFEAVQLELRAAGGRGYVRTSGTARRLREVSFLPVQTPTEVQLRWAIQHSR